MPKATLTSRVLKNKETGLEIQVPKFKVQQELLSNTVHYQVVLASNLACFKSPSHKESDVVQYSVDKKFNEFEDLKNKLTAEFPGTVLPPLNKKSIIVNDAVLRERRASLDHFMKSIASVPKLSTCIPLLEFLGVDKLRAKKFSRGEPLDTKSASPAEEQKDNTLGIGDEGENESNNQVLFEEDEDSGNEDFFGEDGDRGRADNIFGNDDEGESQPGNIKIFESQDLKPDLTEDDEKDFSVFIPDAILTKTETVRTQGNEEDNSDLFRIEDDLDQLMLVKTESQKLKESSTSTPETKPSPSKPTPPTKPSLPSKPKPQIANKPKNLAATNSTSPSSGKPSIPQKPKLSSASQNEHSKENQPALSSANPKDGAAAVDDLGQDDIMKYLQDNLDSNAEEVDLFS